MTKKVAIVTGGTGGIGLATTCAFRNEGWICYAISRHGQQSDEYSITADVTDENSIMEAFRKIYDKEGQIDVLVNNAGFGISGAVEFTEIEDAKRLFDTNFFGGLRGAQAVLPFMRAAGHGKIIFTSSVAAVMPIPFQGFYSATKAAVNMLAGTLGNEVKDFGVQVCAVMPGDVKTGFTSAREKSFAGAQIYGQAIEKSVAVMEHDEQTGMKPEAIAKIILKAAKADKVRPLYTPGIVYKGCVLLGKILPSRAVYGIIGRMYIKR